MAGMTNQSGLQAEMSQATAGTRLVDAEGNVFVTDSGDEIRVREDGILRLTCVLEPVVFEH